MINKYSKIIKRSLFFAIIIICILFSYFVMVRYEVEGEKEMPFNIEKILIRRSIKVKIKSYHFYLYFSFKF